MAINNGPAFSTVAVNGYDVVSYHTEKRPLGGNGHFVSEHDGVTYLFANEQNKARFDSNPEKYVPAYGGFCAFGVSVGKKFYGDPEVWRIVDGKLVNVGRPEGPPTRLAIPSHEGETLKLVRRDAIVSLFIVSLSESP